LTRRRGAGFVNLISLFSILGITVGVMALIVVMAVMSGFSHELRSKIVGMSPHITIQKPGGIAQPDVIIRQIQELDPDLLSANSYVQGQVIVRSQSGAMGAVIQGVPTRFYGEDPLGYAKEYVRSGSLDLTDITSENGPVGRVALGRTLAGMLQVRTGDEIQLISPRFTKDHQLSKKAAKAETFILTGVFELGMSDFDTNLVLMSLDRASDLFSLEGKVSGISVRLPDVSQTVRLQERLQTALGFPFVVQTWEDMNRNFFSAIKVEKAVMRILLALIVMVAAFNIISTLIMVVMEKTKEIGILRALGATRSGIQMIFLLEGFLIGTIGTIAGGLLGYGIASNLNGVAAGIEKLTGYEVFPKDIYYFNEIPAQIIPSDIFFIILFALLMALAAGIYPAFRAGRVSPVEAIRYE